MKKKEYVQNENKAKIIKKEKVKNNIKTECVVIGGGAAGMMAAITAARNGIKVVLVEHTKRLGSKILQTGNGKCNFTNLDMNMSKYQNEEKDFVWEVIGHFDVEHTLNFFENIGVYHKIKNGYVYPNSETAASLQDALRLELKKLNVEVYEDFEVDSVKETQNGYDIYGNIIVKENNKTAEKTVDERYCVHTVSLIIATGSMASPKTGSDGSGYKLAKSLGHNIKKPLPALVQLISDSELCKGMAGVRSTGKVELVSQDGVVAYDIGEIQYTDYGISGIPVFQISRHAVKLVDQNKSVDVIIDMLPEFKRDELNKKVAGRVECDKDKTVEQFFSGLLNKKLVSAVARRNKIDVNKRMCDLKSKEIEKMINTFKKFYIHITGFKDYSNAQVCQGGVELKQINSETMESKLCKRLYFAGEITDVDGKCGGYNLQWAWSSGYTAGKSAAEAVKNIK